MLEPRTTQSYAVMVNESTVLVVTKFSNGDAAEIAMSIQQARDLAVRLNEAVALAPQTKAAN